MEDSLTIAAHSNIYTGHNRELRIDFVLPDKTNNQTKILILVPGFSGNIDSKIYIKMRRYFSQKYNFIVLQCNYFGSDYMQAPKNLMLRGNFSDIQNNFTEQENKEILANNSNIFKFLFNKQMVLNTNEVLHETPDHFAEMGYMQAIDIITALEAIKILLRSNNIKFNNNIWGWGHSQGAYLLHLVNLLNPSLFDVIIDNSGWLQPQFLLNRERIYTHFYGDAKINTFFRYQGANFIPDHKMLNLIESYKGFSNEAFIYSFMGTNDYLFDWSEKKKLLNQLNNTKLRIISKEDIDGIIFKTNNHGLDADFIKMFDSIMEEKINYSNPRTFNTKQVSEFRLGDTLIKVDYTKGLPIFDLKFNFYKN